MNNDLLSHISNFISEIKKDKKITFSLIISMAVIVVIIVSEFSFGASENKNPAPDINKNYYFTDEKEVEAFLENIHGAGKVSVLIMYDTSEEYIYAKDTEEDTKSEKDKGREINYKSQHIIIKEDGDEKGLRIKEIYPEIRGVAVICEGGDNPVVKEQIMSILTALFDINTNSISVAAGGS